jgi:hypothetical protein
VSAPPSIGTATKTIVESGKVKARGEKPPCFPRASGSTQQKVQTSVVMEKKSKEDFHHAEPFAEP